MLEIKHLPDVEFKFDDSPGTFDGILSTYGNKDHVGDICVRGCFEDTIKEKGLSRVLLWNHEHGSVIGSFNITGHKNDLSIYATTDQNVQLGREKYSLLKNGHIKGLSIGYIANDFKYEKDGTRMLTKVDLWEGSLVTFPANPMAHAQAKFIDAKAMADVRIAFCSLPEIKELPADMFQIVMKAIDSAFSTDTPSDAGIPSIASVNDSVPDGELKAYNDLMSALKRVG